MGEYEFAKDRMQILDTKSQSISSVDEAREIIREVMGLYKLSKDKACFLKGFELRLGICDRDSRDLGTRFDSRPCGARP